MTIIYMFSLLTMLRRKKIRFFFSKQPCLSFHSRKKTVPTCNYMELQLNCHYCLTLAKIMYFFYMAIRVECTVRIVNLSYRAICRKIYLNTLKCVLSIRHIIFWSHVCNVNVTSANFSVLLVRCICGCIVTLVSLTLTS